MLHLIYKIICIPESFDYTITFMNSQHYRTQIQKVILYSKTGIKRWFYRLLKYKLNQTQIWQIHLIRIKVFKKV